MKDNPNGIEEDGALASHPNQASRVTKIGRFLRNNDLDETAQVINVLRGEMSILGSFRARSVTNTQDVAESDPEFGQLWHEKFLTVAGSILTLAGLDPDRKISNGRNVRLDLWEHEHTSLLLDLFKINNFLLNHLGIKSLSKFDPYH